MFLKIFSLAILLIVVLPVAGAPIHREYEMSVCEFVQRADVLKGRIVKVRGVVMMDDTAPDSAPAYLISMCPEMRTGIIRVKLEFPDVRFLKEPPKGFHIDKNSFHHAHQIVISTLKDGKTNDLYVATISGQAFAPPSPPTPSPGFHVTREGSYDAGLIIEGIYDMEISKQ